MSAENYESNFAVPEYTVADVHYTGITRVTEVIIDGETAVFEIDEVTHRKTAALADRNDEGDSLSWLT